MMTSDSTARPLTGRFVLVVIVTFFLVVIGVNIVMMRLAITTLPGTEVDSPYSAGLAYRQEIAAAARQDERNWKIDAHVERAPEGTASLIIHARDAEGKPLSGLIFSGRLERPTDRRGDRAADVAELGNGDYRGVALDVSPGQWDIVIEADSQGQRVFRSKNRVVLN